MRRAALDAMATGPMMRRASNHENSADRNSATVSPGDVELQIPLDRRERALPEQETVAGGIVHQQLDLLADDLGVAIDVADRGARMHADRPPDFRRPRTRRPRGDAAPSRRRRLPEPWRRPCAARDDCDRSAAIVRSSESVLASVSIWLVEAGADRRVRGQQPLRRGDPHRGEVRAGGTSVVDRHQDSSNVFATRSPAWRIPRMEYPPSATADGAHREAEDQNLGADRTLGQSEARQTAGCEREMPHRSCILRLLTGGPYPRYARRTTILKPRTCAEDCEI